MTLYGAIGLTQLQQKTRTHDGETTSTEDQTRTPYQEELETNVVEEKANSKPWFKICCAVFLGLIAALIILVSIQQAIARENMLAMYDEQADLAAAARGWTWRNEKSEMTVRQGFSGQVLEINSDD